MSYPGGGVNINFIQDTLQIKTSLQAYFGLLIKMVLSRVPIVILYHIYLTYLYLIFIILYQHILMIFIQLCKRKNIEIYNDILSVLSSNINPLLLYYTCKLYNTYDRMTISITFYLKTGKKNVFNTDLFSKLNCFHISI